MESKVASLNRFSSFKIVLLYAAVSAVYIYSSDYFLETCIKNIDLLTKLQTYKGLGFILVTTALLFILVKKNIHTISAYYQKIIDVKYTADNQVRNSREEYMSLFNHSPLPMWIFDTDTLRFLMVNEAACQIYGFSREEYRSMTLKDIRPSEDISHMERLVALSLTEAEFSFPDIARHRKKNGEIIQVKIKNTLVTFEGKKVKLASAIDVTAEVNAQNKLIETNSRLQLASEIANLGYWTNDLVNAQIRWSEEIYKIFEVDPETFELSLGNIKKHFHPDGHANFDAGFHTNFEDHRIKESEQQIITGSGKTKWILERQHLIKDENGRPIRLEGIALDITDRKLHEKEVWESNERFKMLAKATVESIIDWDIQNDKVIWGEGFNTVLGYDLTKYDNYLWSENIHPDDKERVLNDLHKTLKDPTKEYFNAEFRFLKANRDVVCVQHKGLFIRNAKGEATRALAAMTDLTESQDRLRKIEMQNRALKDIAWTQSHIVRAPLANLMGLVNILKWEALNEAQRSLIDNIGESAEKLDVIVREIVKKTMKIDDL